VGIPRQNAYVRAPLRWNRHSRGRHVKAGLQLVDAVRRAQCRAHRMFAIEIETPRRWGAWVRGIRHTRDDPS
jgi:hypothetical protein